MYYFQIVNATVTQSFSKSFNDSAIATMRLSSDICDQIESARDSLNSSGKKDIGFVVPSDLFTVNGLLNQSRGGMLKAGKGNVPVSEVELAIVVNKRGFHFQVGGERSEGIPEVIANSQAIPFEVLGHAKQWIQKLTDKFADVLCEIEDEVNDGR